MQLEPIKRIAPTAMLICGFYIALVYLPSKVDALRREMEQKLAAQEKNPRGGANRDQAMLAANASMSKRLDDLESRLNQIAGSTETAADRPDGAIADLRTEIGRLRSDYEEQARRLDTTVRQLEDRIEFVSRASLHENPGTPSARPASPASTSDTGGLATRIVETVDDWEIEARGATRSDDRVTVTLRITNRGADREFSVQPTSSPAYDQAGAVLRLQQVTMGGRKHEVFGNRVLSQRFVGGIPTVVGLEYQGATDSTSEVAALDLCISVSDPSDKGKTAKLRRIPITR